MVDNKGIPKASYKLALRTNKIFSRSIYLTNLFSINLWKSV